MTGYWDNCHNLQRNMIVKRDCTCFLKGSDDTLTSLEGVLNPVSISHSDGLCILAAFHQSLNTLSAYNGLQ